MSSSPSLHVLGVGAIGTLLSHHIRLANPSLPITLLSRRELPTSLRVEHEGRVSTSSPFLVEQLPQDINIEPKTLTPTPNPTFNSAQLPDHSRSSHLQPITSLLVCLKAPLTIEAIRPLLPRLTSESVIALLQNGMGVHQQLSQTFWPTAATRPAFLIGTTAHGVSSIQKQDQNQQGEGGVRHHTPSGAGEVKWGIVAPTPEEQEEAENCFWPERQAIIARTPSDLSPPLSLSLPNALEHQASKKLVNLQDTVRILLSPSDLGPSLLPRSELEIALLLKLAVNAVVNPLTALLGRGQLTNGSLLSPRGLALVEALTSETSRVLLAHLSLSSDTSPPSLSLNSDLSTKNNAARDRGRDLDLDLFQPANLKERIVATLRATAGNTSSMAVDLRDGRRTEIQYINGYIEKLGKEMGVETPLNSMMKGMVGFVGDQ